MSDFKLNITIGTTSIQLEGEGSLVRSILEELREKGLGELNNTPIAPVITNASANTNMLDSETTQSNNSTTNAGDEVYPSLKEISLKTLPKSESEWILLYSFYASDFGKKPVSRAEIKNMYIVTNRMTVSRSNNFFNSLTSVVSSNYLSALNDDEYIVREEGKAKIKEIFSRENSSENKAKKNIKTKQYQLIKDLDLSDTQTRKGLKTFVNELNPTSNINISATIIYYLQQIYNYGKELNGDVIFTCWRELGKKIPNNLNSNLRDVCSSKYGYADNNNSVYSITARGINLVEHTLKEGMAK